MVKISYMATVALISLIWCLARAAVAARAKRVDWKREAQLLFVYVCIVVVVRFTFFPFFEVDGKIQPLIFEAGKILPFRINLVPFVNLLDYPNKKEILINVIGNSTMFIPLGIVWPCVYKELDRAWKTILAGVGFSLCIELLQLLFYDRVTDVDDLILNSFGFVAGYLLYLLARGITRKVKAK